MILKAIIEQCRSLDEIKVRIPQFHGMPSQVDCTPTDELPNASICAIPGLDYIPVVGDVVWVEFERDKTELPTIVGLLASAPYKSSANLTLNELLVNSTAKLPQETTIGKITTAELLALSGVDKNLSEWINEKITFPSGGTDGDVLTKDGNGVKWSAGGGGGGTTYYAANGVAIEDRTIEGETRKYIVGVIANAPTASASGTMGVVPAPTAGQTNYILSSGEYSSGTNIKWVSPSSIMSGYLPLTAGSSYPLTGTLYSSLQGGTSSNPAIGFRWDAHNGATYGHSMELTCYNDGTYKTNYGLYVRGYPGGGLRCPIFEYYGYSYNESRLYFGGTNGQCPQMYIQATNINLQTYGQGNSYRNPITLRTRKAIFGDADGPFNSVIPCSDNTVYLGYDTSLGDTATSSSNLYWKGLFTESIKMTIDGSHQDLATYLATVATIDDTASSATSTYSSSKIESIIPDMSAYLPLTAGSTSPLTGPLYTNITYTETGFITALALCMSKSPVSIFEVEIQDTNAGSGGEAFEILCNGNNVMTYYAPSNTILFGRNQNGKILSYYPTLILGSSGYSALIRPQAASTGSVGNSTYPFASSYINTMYTKRASTDTTYTEVGPNLLPVADTSGQVPIYNGSAWGVTSSLIKAKDEQTFSDGDILMYEEDSETGNGWVSCIPTWIKAKSGQTFQDGDLLRYSVDATGSGWVRWSGGGWIKQSSSDIQTISYTGEGISPLILSMPNTLYDYTLLGFKFGSDTLLPQGYLGVANVDTSGGTDYEPVFATATSTTTTLQVLATRNWVNQTGVRSLGGAVGHILLEEGLHIRTIETEEEEVQYLSLFPASGSPLYSSVLYYNYSADTVSWKAVSDFILSSSTTTQTITDSGNVIPLTLKTTQTGATSDFIGFAVEGSSHTTTILGYLGINTITSTATDEYQPTFRDNSGVNHTLATRDWVTANAVTSIEDLGHGVSAKGEVWLGDGLFAVEDSIAGNAIISLIDQDNVPSSDYTYVLFYDGASSSDRKIGWRNTINFTQSYDSYSQSIASGHTNNPLNLVTMMNSATDCYLGFKKTLGAVTTVLGYLGITTVTSQGTDYFFPAFKETLEGTTHILATQDYVDNYSVTDIDDIRGSFDTGLGVYTYYQSSTGTNFINIYDMDNPPEEDSLLFFDYQNSSGVSDIYWTPISTISLPYLPLTAGSDAPLTGAIYLNGVEETTSTSQTTVLAEWGSYVGSEEHKAFYMLDTAYAISNSYHYHEFRFKANLGAYQPCVMDVESNTYSRRTNITIGSTYNSSLYLDGTDYITLHSDDITVCSNGAESPMILHPLANSYNKSAYLGCKSSLNSAIGNAYWTNIFTSALETTLPSLSNPASSLSDSYQDVLTWARAAALRLPIASNGIPYYYGGNTWATITPPSGTEYSKCLRASMVAGDVNPTYDWVTVVSSATAPIYITNGSFQLYYLEQYGLTVETPTAGGYSYLAINANPNYFDFLQNYGLTLKSCVLNDQGATSNWIPITVKTQIEGTSTYTYSWDYIEPPEQSGSTVETKVLAFTTGTGSGAGYSWIDTSLGLYGVSPIYIEDNGVGLKYNTSQFDLEASSGSQGVLDTLHIKNNLFMSYVTGTSAGDALLWDGSSWYSGTPTYSRYATEADYVDTTAAGTGLTYTAVYSGSTLLGYKLNVAYPVPSYGSGSADKYLRVVLDQESGEPYLIWDDAVSSYADLAGALYVTSAIGSTSQPVFFNSDGEPEVVTGIDASLIPNLNYIPLPTASSTNTDKMLVYDGTSWSPRGLGTTLTWGSGTTKLLNVNYGSGLTEDDAEGREGDLIVDFTAVAHASHEHSWSDITSGKPTTLSGYGITDAKIANGTITLGSNTITPLTQHQSLDGYVQVTGTLSANYFVQRNNTNTAWVVAQVPTLPSVAANNCLMYSGVSSGSAGWQQLSPPSDTTVDYVLAYEDLDDTHEVQWVSQAKFAKVGNQNTFTQPQIFQSSIIVCGTETINKTILFNDTGNPYIQMTCGGTNFHLQAYDGCIGVGPGWAGATKWDPAGNMSVYGQLSAGGKATISGALKIGGRYYGQSGYDDEGLIVDYVSSGNPIACITLGTANGQRASLYCAKNIGDSSYNNKTWIRQRSSLGITYNLFLPQTSGTFATQEWVSANFQPKTCLIEGTKITMYDGTEKNVEDVKTGDAIMAYDPTTDEFVEAVVIKNTYTGEGADFDTMLFDDGSHVETYGIHSFYRKDTGNIVPVEYWNVGNHAVKVDGTNPTLMWKEKVKYTKYKKHYELISSHYSYIANGIVSGHGVQTAYLAIKRWESSDGNICFPSTIMKAFETEMEKNDCRDQMYVSPKFIERGASMMATIHSLKKKIEKDQKQLDDTDYTYTKSSEKFLSALKNLKSFTLLGIKSAVSALDDIDTTDRDTWRNEINELRPQLATQQEALKTLKSEMEGNTPNKALLYQAAVHNARENLNTIKIWAKDYCKHN